MLRVPGEFRGSSKCPHCKEKYSSLHRFKDHLQRDHLMPISSKSLEEIDGQIRLEINLEGKKDFEKRLKEMMIWIKGDRRRSTWERKQSNKPRF